MEIIGERGPAALSWAVLGAKLSHALQFHAGSRGVGPAALFGRLGTVFGDLGRVWGCLGVVLGRFWGGPGPFWDGLGGSGAVLGAILGALGERFQNK